MKEVRVCEAMKSPVGTLSDEMVSSVFRNFEGTVENLDGNLVVNGHKIRVFSENDAAMLPWSQCGACLLYTSRCV